MRELGRYNSVIGWCLFVLVCVGTDAGDGVGINEVAMLVLINSVE